jgi:hypothetical protein
MNKTTKIILGVGAVALLYFILKPIVKRELLTEKDLLP